ncbi:apoptosis-associated speck-like protein containing a CARD [Rana temporaria]|uniref:apoptosis-associated speck-like protein containing a CARD n=1 Tax=Rana temporaria TaxID=8407 RepID=UPI001AAD7278|nr:apoptosis-associated speck-like protein containing a CARD [Rana temporaria]
MARTVRDALITALDELDEKTFKRFRNKLNDWPTEAGFNKIPRSKLETADREDVVDLILRWYMASYGPELTADVLDKINEKQVASDLKKDLETVEGFKWREKDKVEPQSTSEASSSSAPKPQVVPFVDEHREALISRCVQVAPILDGLLSKGLIIDEDYDVILAEKTSQDRMRKLYTFIRGWSPSHKKTLYEILKDKNRPLIEDLEQSS